MFGFKSCSLPLTWWPPLQQQSSNTDPRPFIITRKPPSRALQTLYHHLQRHCSTRIVMIQANKAPRMRTIPLASQYCRRRRCHHHHQPRSPTLPTESALPPTSPPSPLAQRKRAFDPTFPLNEEAKQARASPQESLGASVVAPPSQPLPDHAAIWMGLEGIIASTSPQRNFGCFWEAKSISEVRRRPPRSYNRNSSAVCRNEF